MREEGIDAGCKPGSPAEYGIDDAVLGASRVILRDSYGVPYVAGSTASEAGEDTI
jgi:hypothetical protein